MNMSAQIPSVNFHVWKPCNMSCSFCFATFHDLGNVVLPKGHLFRGEALSVVDALAEAGFNKINFAGGEPTLCPWLPDLLRRAKGLKLTTSIVTNGSCITPEWLDRVDGCLDWAAVSIDTVDPEKLKHMGRTTRNGPLSGSDYLRIMDLLRLGGVRLKTNTVVTTSNKDEDLARFIADAQPERWKVFQVLPVRGQNDALVDDLLVTDAEFASYVSRNRYVEDLGVVLVVEGNDLMTGSYVMVDPAGRFFDNVAGTHSYSQPINQVGVHTALGEVSVDPDKFRLRDGLYEWTGEQG